MIMFCSDAFSIDILFEISLLTSVLDVLTSICDAFGFNLAEINKFECTL